MKHDPDIRALLRHINRVSAFLRWLREDGDRLVAAADHPGRPGRGAPVQSSRPHAAVTTSSPTGPRSARSTGCSLDLVHEPDCAEGVRLCTDALDRGVRAIEALHLAGIVRIREV